MKKLFVCLANSRKYSGRCVAGVETDNSTQEFKMNPETGRPQWIRPVTTREHGEVPHDLVWRLKVGDLVEMEAHSPCPNGYQSENFMIPAQAPKAIGKACLERIEQLAENHLPTLFGNRGKAIPREHIEKYNYSLTLIRVEDVRIYFKERERNIQPRMLFIFNHNQYDLPVTDLDFILDYRQNNDILIGANAIYLTISLSMLHEDWYYKLVAGVLIV